MNKSLYKAIKTSVSGRFLSYFVQFISLALLARIFTPAEFGVIASIQVFVIFFQMLADVGMGPAIINEKEFNSEKRDGIFSVTAIVGILLAVLFYIFSYTLNYFYGGYEYQDIAKFVCVGIFFNALNIVPMTAMNKDTKFIHLAGIDVFVEVIALLIVFILYIQNFGLVALASRPATQGVFKFILVWISSIKSEIGRPCFGRQIHHIKSILAFSLYQFGFNFINYFSRNLDNILIAKYFGMSAVGVYEKAYQLMRYPLMVTTYAMTPAVQPVLTKFRSDKERIILEHNLLTSRLLALSLPISVFLFQNSENIVIILFGEKWLEAVPLIEIFSFMIPIQSVLSTSGSFFQVMNKPKLLFLSGAISAMFSVSAIVLGTVLGEINYVAYFLVMAFVVNFFQAYYLLFKYCFKSSIRPFYLSLLKSVAVMSLPISTYYTFHTLVLKHIKYLAIIDVSINAFFGLISLAFFYIPIKRILR